MKKEIITAFLLGFLATYFLKYVVFGLERWDMMFHPERLQADTTGPYQHFTKPFLGVLG